MRPHVLMLTSDARAGGIQTALALYMQALERAGWPHRLVVPEGAPIAGTEVRERVTTEGRAAWWRFRHGLGGPIARACRDAAVVVTHNNRLIRPARRAGRPVLAVAHGDKQRDLDRATAVAALTGTFAATLRERGIAAVHTLKHALPPSFEPTERHERGAGPVVVLAAGRFVAKKGFACWLEAMAAVGLGADEVRFVLAGDGEERRPLEREAARLGVAVDFPGWRPIGELLAGASIFCLPSSDEPFGLVLIEAMAAGLACVATRTHGPLDLVEDGVDGLLVPIGDAPAMAAAVRALASDPALRQRLGDAARAKVLGPSFTLDRLAADLDAVLKATLARG